MNKRISALLIFLSLLPCGFAPAQAQGPQDGHSILNPPKLDRGAVSARTEYPSSGMDHYRQSAMSDWSTAIDQPMHWNASMPTCEVGCSCGGSGLEHRCLPCQRGFCGYDCACGGADSHRPWKHQYPVDFEQDGPGEYAGPARLQHLLKYQVRAGDSIQITYSLSRALMYDSYRIGVGDQIMIESLSDPGNLNRGTLDRGIEVQQDGTISVRLLGRLHAAGLTMDQLAELLEKQYLKYYKKPGIDVTPVRTNVAVTDIQNAIGGIGGFNEQSITRLVTPDGMISLPKIGQFRAHGLSIDEIKQEANLRYKTVATGLDVEIALGAQAPHFVTVLGEVRTPGRFEMVGPTTALSALGLAGGRRPGGNLRQIVVFRRADDWRLISTVLDLRGAVLGKNPLPVDEIWLRDGDIVIVPTSPIQQFDNFVSLVFTQGIYGVVPFTGFDLVEAVNGFETDNDN